MSLLVGLKKKDTFHTGAHSEAIEGDSQPLVGSEDTLEVGEQNSEGWVVICWYSQFQSTAEGSGTVPSWIPERACRKLICL